MARYSAFLGRSVEVQYRAGDICLPASGMFVGDSGRSIFLEQHYVQHGQPKNFRWEIPYPCIVRLEERESLQQAASPSDPLDTSPLDEAAATATDRTLRANAAHASGGAAALLPISGRAETA
ncbi:MAG TPA: hypothetical protein VIW23_13325 [Candidatus Acidoferrum sp.]|jgi:hypothetical protein